MFSTANGIDVRVSDVDFTFPGESRKTITGVTFEVKSGQSIAFIGPSGAGKTTLINIIMGFLKPESGTVLINGQPPSAFIEENPGAIGYVPQFPSLIRGSIADNIALGVPPQEVNKSCLSEAISVAQLQEWCESLPAGVETKVNARSLSGGQIQRIGIARALYTRPKLLIMDEPTGALDGQTERALTEDLASASNGITTLTIAHRLSTIESSDNVLYLVDGVIQGSGTLDELRKSNRAVESLAQQFTLGE